MKPCLQVCLVLVLDVSKFPAAVSRVEMSSAIVNRFTAYKVNAVQFVGNLARVTFSSASDRDAVMRFESVRVGDVDCVVRGGGPRPQKVFVYGYPVEGNSNLLTDALSRYGEVHDVRFRTGFTCLRWPMDLEWYPWCLTRLYHVP